jgi:hypothetical protein
MLPWSVAVVGVLVACAGWARAGRIARKLDALNQSYWELRYDFTRLRSQVARLDPESEQSIAEASPAQSAGQVAFVSLSSMKKKG